MKLRLRALACGVVFAAGCAPRASGSVARANPPRPSFVRSSFDLDGTNVSVHLPRSSTAARRGVLLLHSAMGRSPSVLEYADSLAQHGYAVYALDFFRGRVAREVAEGRALRDEANSRAEALERLVSDAYGRLETDPRIGAKQRFLVGFSYGAAWATHLAGKLPDVSGVVAFYGESFTNEADLAERITAPLLLIGAERDPASTQASFETIAERLRANGVDAKVSSLDAAHGFAESRHPGFDPGTAAEGWRLCLAWLQQH